MSTTPERALKWVGAVAVALAAALVVACGPDPTTARGMAESFLDAHYVHIDLPGALPFTSGVARSKVEREIALTAGQPIDETTRKPTVRYALRQERPEGDVAVQYLYEGTIAVEDAGKFTQRWLVTVRRTGADWRVTNFEELAD